jgi:hypothetical protein
MMSFEAFTKRVLLLPWLARASSSLAERKEKFTLFSDHNGSLLRRQPGAMTIGHSPKGKEKSST